MSAERVEDSPAIAPEPPPPPKTESNQKQYDKLTTSKLAKQMGIKTKELKEKLVAAGLLENKDGKPYLTEQGKEAGAELRSSSKFGPYFIWPKELKLE